ncbi:MAG TPA: permease [Thermoflexales bacterium]|nr:permease [Thermoflexales bacterium]HQW35872.1 permease [Thermoflexales bacterium]HQZ23003.1 permease [Thermoflexales bacterium]HQZ99432.1 permease [Thermoflexales bacterium]
MEPKKLAGVAAAILAVVLGTLALDSLSGVLAGGINLPDAAQNFVTVFLGIFIEAAPFLLIGALASGFIAVFVTPETLARLVPRNIVLATLFGALLGMIFPVCECGVVPVARRLYRKGLPTPVGIAFLLGAPVLNPIVIASTYAAFGPGPIFWGRIGFTLLIAVAVGLVFSAEPNLIRVLRPRALVVAGGMDPAPARTSSTAGAQVQAALNAAANDFFDMGRYMIGGMLIATALQTFVPQQTLVSIGGGSISSVIALQLLAFALSVCSTVDAFLALSFINTFTTGAIIAFLVFGPMLDVKSIVMYLGVFRARVVVYLSILVFLMALVIGVFINLNVVW